jgi:hypothetical protein
MLIVLLSVQWFIDGALLGSTHSDIMSGFQETTVTVAWGAFLVMDCATVAYAIVIFAYGTYWIQNVQRIICIYTVLEFAKIVSDVCMIIIWFSVPEAEIPNDYGIGVMLFTTLLISIGNVNTVANCCVWQNHMPRAHPTGSTDRDEYGNGASQDSSCVEHPADVYTSMKDTAENVSTLHPKTEYRFGDADSNVSRKHHKPRVMQQMSIPNTRIRESEESAGMSIRSTSGRATHARSPFKQRFPLSAVDDRDDSHHGNVLGLLADGIRSLGASTPSHSSAVSVDNTIGTTQTSTHSRPQTHSSRSVHADHASPPPSSSGALLDERRRRASNYLRNR